MASIIADKIDGIDAFEVRNAADTLVRAKEIEQDKKLFAAAQKEIDRKMKAAAQAKLDAIEAVSKKSSNSVHEPTVTIQV